MIVQHISVRYFIILLIVLVSSTGSFYAGSFNKIVGRLRIGDFLHTKNIFVGANAHIGGNLTINGTINGKQISDLGSGLTILPPLQENSVARVADTTGNLLKGSTVIIDDSGNISGVNDIALTTISKQGLSGVTVEWPNEVGAAGTFLGSDGAGHLVYATPAGAGNVSTAAFFTDNNRITVTDVPSGSTDIKQSGITIDESNNIIGANTVTAATFNGTFNGNATSATAVTGLFGAGLGSDVSGRQNVLTVNFVGGETATDIATGVGLANTATSANTKSTIVRRNGNGDFSAGTITANLTGNVIGNLSGTATHATNALSANSAQTLSEPLPLNGDVTGTHQATVVSAIAEQSAVDVAAATQTVQNATPNNMPHTLVLRNESGNFETNMITLSGSVTNPTDATTKAYVDEVASGGNVSTAALFSDDNRIVITDLSSGQTHITQSGVTIDNANNITGANTITATAFNGNLNGNAATATTLSVNLAGEVTGPTKNTVVDNIGGINHPAIVSRLTVVGSASDMSSANTLVRRSTAGNFAGNEITAVNFNATNFFNGNLNGNAATATDATNLKTPLGGEVIGVATNNTIDHIDTFDRAAILDHLQTVANATELATPDTLVYRDNSNTVAVGTINATTLNATNFNGGTFNGTFNGNATSADTFNDSLRGDVTGTQFNTIVTSVSGQLASDIASATTLTSGATNTNVAGALVRRHGTTGGFSAGPITASFIGDVTGNLTGTATNAAHAITAVNFSGTLSGEVTGKQDDTQVQSINGQSRAALAHAAVAVALATSTATEGTLVLRGNNGDFSAGEITGSLNGNAATATLATTATTALSANSAQTLSEPLPLNGDVTGTHQATVVSAIAGQSAVDVATATQTVQNATPNNMPDTLVLRNESGNFETNMVTLSGSVTNPTDATTKAYVDQVAGAGLSVKTPARVVATNNITQVTTGGLPVIDGVQVNVGDRVLLTNQLLPVQNGLWIAQLSLVPWTRPSDFSNGQTVGQAYVLILAGNTYGGSSWLSSTPHAVIGTNSIFFSQFSVSNTTQGANVGSGVGQIFRDKTGATLNFKTLTQSNHVVLTNNANTVNIATNGTNLNTANTLVARDGSGNFSAGTITANVTGSSSNNVLKSGDTMTGNLEMRSQSDVRFFDADNSGFVGLQAPANVTSYTVDLPSIPPEAGQYLQARSATALQWGTVGGEPNQTRAFYVELNGDDANDGSLGAPFASINKAVQEANAIASLPNPVAIHIGSGHFLVDNSGGPVTITAPGVSIIGQSRLSTLIEPINKNNNVFQVRVTYCDIENLTLSGGDIGSSSSNASAIVLNTDLAGLMRINEVTLFRFARGIECSSSNGAPILITENVQFSGNVRGIDGTNIRLIIKDNIFLGPVIESLGSVNTGIVASGINTLITIMESSFRFMNTAVSVTGGALLRLLSSNVESTINGIVLSGGSKSTITGCNFVTNLSNSVNIDVSGEDTFVAMTGTQFAGQDSNNVAQGIAMRVTNGAHMAAASTLVQNVALAIACGGDSDTSSTDVEANGIMLEDCIQDIIHRGSSRLQFVGGTFDSEKVAIINDASNVTLAAFNIHETETDETTSLAIGTLTDDPFTVYEILNDDEEPLPVLAYEPNFYGYKGTVYRNSSSGEATFNGTHAHDSDSAYYVLTGDNADKASLCLISDTSNSGDSDNVRGWEIFKEGTSAGLQFQYRNNDAGQATRGANSVMRLNGFDNQVEFPVATTAPLPINTVARLVWAGDTNLYRSSAGILRTDGNIAIGGLTAQRVVTTNANNQLVSSTVTSTELTALSGVTSSVQTQLNNKVAKAGDVMAGALEVPIGSAASPTVRFTGSTTTGIFSPTPNAFAIAAAGLERLRVSGTGIVTINSLAGAAGVVHSNSLGNLSSSLIVNADVAAGANIADTKLATISTAGKVANSATTATTVNTPDTIVLRDGSGKINNDIIGAATLNVLKEGDTMTGALTLPAGSAASPSLQFTGSTNTGLSAQTANNMTISSNGNSTVTFSPVAIQAVVAFVLTNIMANQSMQVIAPSTNGSVSINPGTAILLLTHNGTVNNYTIIFPANPIHGQIFSILLGTDKQISFINQAGLGGAAIVNGLTNLNPGSTLNASSGGTSVTYIYAQPTNSWYRFDRG